MNRRSFIKKVGLATAGAFAAPYILPSGRLFAATGARKANHVVFCLYAGGVRSFESTDKMYGNLMPSILSGNESIKANILPAMSALPTSPVSQPLQKLGTLYAGFQMKRGPTGHYSGHATALTGAYLESALDIKQRPPTPTVFEYYRKHSSPTKNALNSWWVANTLGPYPALNYSNYPGYGPMYGANFIAPTSLISQAGYDALGNMRNFSSAEQATSIKIKQFLDNNFKQQYTDPNAGIINDNPDFATLQSYITDSFNKAVAGQYNNPWNSPSGMSNDMYNVFFAEEIIKQFKPELLVVNMQDVDVCHTNFTAYCNNLRKADYAVAHLWNTIQNTPGMANDTVLIVAPEHGRNAKANSLVDAYGEGALDHTDDDVARKIFCLVLGPPGVVKQDQYINIDKGESIDIVPTIANVLGFDSEIPSNMLLGSFLQDAFN